MAADLFVTGLLNLGGAFFDSGNSPGTVGQVLSSTVTGTDWVNNPAGDVVAVPTPLDNQLAIWTGPNSIEGNASLTFDATGRLAIGPQSPLTDLTIFQKVGDETIKGLTLSGEGFSGSEVTTDGFTMVLNNNSPADMRMLMTTALKNGLPGGAIRFIVGNQVPNICSFAIGTGGGGLNFCDSNPAARLAVGLSAVNALLSQILAKLYVKATPANVGFMVQANAAQVSSLSQLVDSSAVILTDFDEDGKLTIGGAKLATVADRSMLDVRGSVAVKRTPTAVNISTVDEVIIGITAIPGGGLTVTIQSADIVAGRIFIIKDESDSASNQNPITIETEGSEEIDGFPSAQITANFGVVRLYSNGVNLFSW